MPESTIDGALEAVDRYLNAISGRDYDGMVAKYFMGMGPDDVFEIKEKFSRLKRSLRAGIVVPSSGTIIG